MPLSPPPPPPGLVYPTDSEFISRLKELEKNQQEESIPLIPTTPQELEDMLRLCCYTPLNLPRQVQNCATWSKIQIKTLLRLQTLLKLLQIQNQHITAATVNTDILQLVLMLLFLPLLLLQYLRNTHGRHGRVCVCVCVCVCVLSGPAWSP